MNKKHTESYLTFKLQGELFAVSVHKVLEIIETGEEHAITCLPKAHPSIAGVVNFRGNVIPVVDTRMKFDLEPYTKQQKFVVIVLNLFINNTNQFVGAKADKVVDVIEVTKEEIKPIPEVGQGYNSEFIQGVIHRNGQFIMLLNLEAAMSTDEIIQIKTEEEANQEADADSSEAGCETAANP